MIEMSKKRPGKTRLTKQTQQSNMRILPTDRRQNGSGLLWKTRGHISALRPRQNGTVFSCAREPDTARPTQAMSYMAAVGSPSDPPSALSCLVISSAVLTSSSAEWTGAP